MTAPGEMLEAALGYAARGWPVFPLHSPVTTGPKVGPHRAQCSCGAPGCGSPGKHPRTHHGLADATTDPDTIRGWWDRWPGANIGLPTGVAFDVLDLDGVEALDALDALAPPEAGTIRTPMVRTGRGIHMYLAPLGARNRAGMAPGVDWRGTGGYVVAPPSVHHLHGDRYEWAEDRGPDMLMAEVDPWLAGVVLNRRPKAARGAPGAPCGAGGSRYGLRALEGELGRLATAGEGARNDTLVRAAYRVGQLVAGGELDARHAVTEMLRVAERIGLGEVEAERTVASGMTSGCTTPRSAT